jgi:hypothetical protein
MVIMIMIVVAVMTVAVIVMCGCVTSVLALRWMTFSGMVITILSFLRMRMPQM